LVLPGAIGFALTDGLVQWIFLALIVVLPGFSSTWWRYVKTGTGQPPVAFTGLNGGDRRLVLQHSGAKTTQVIKVIRQITGLGLTEAQEMVDSPPSVVAGEMTEKAAERAARLLRSAGADVVVEATMV
jgi:Ribosomal protein L7/L12 C-terminal domain